MPELPEVEVTKLGIEPKVKDKKVTQVIIYDGRLRWPVPSNLNQILKGQTCSQILRRGKYLLLRFEEGTLIIHLGMTGVLRIQPKEEPPRKHDRIEIQFRDIALRLHDPRKFGAMLWHELEAGAIEDHPLIAKLGVEPFSEEFKELLGGRILYQKSRKRLVSIKQFLLAGQAVVGVGNIYCSESLFEAKINPKTPAGKISEKRYQLLAHAIRKVLQKAIAAGGSSMKDFVNSEGEPGHFMMQTKVYGRKSELCLVCKSKITQIVQNQRSTYYCKKCQK